MKDQQKQKIIANTVLAVGMLVLLAGAVMPFFTLDIYTSRWVLAAGALMALVARFMEPTIDKDESLRLHRLQRLDKVTAVIFCLSAACLFVNFFVDPYEYREVIQAWVPILLAGAVLQLYCTFMTELERKKLAKKQKEEAENGSKKKKNAKKQ